MIDFLNIEIFTMGPETFRLFHIPLFILGIWLIYILIKMLFKDKPKKPKTLADARDMVTKYLGSKFMLFPPGNNNPKYTITYNHGGEGDVNIAIARGTSFKAVFEIARDWVSNNYVNQQLGKSYYVLLPDAGNDFKHIILRRPKGTETAEVISHGNSLQDAVENAFLILCADKNND